MRLQSVLFLVVVLSGFGFFGFNVRRLISYLQIGKPDQRTDRGWQRLQNVFVVAFGQSKLLREPVAGVMHLLIYWGFVVLLIAVLESVVEWVIP